MAHVIHLAVQLTLITLKANPSDDAEEYHVSQGRARARTLSLGAQETGIAASMDKLRRHMYAFRSRRGWRDQLKKQAKAIGAAYRQLTLDMLVRWLFTHTMLNTTLGLERAINGVCAVQTMDPTIK